MHEQFSAWSQGFWTLCTLSVWVGKRLARMDLTNKSGTIHTAVVSRMTSHTLFSERQLRAAPEETQNNIYSQLDFLCLTGIALSQTHQQMKRYLKKHQTIHHFAWQTILQSTLPNFPIRTDGWLQSSNACPVQSRKLKASHFSMRFYNCLSLDLLSSEAHLNTHNNDQRCFYGDGKCLLVWGVGPVFFHHNRECSVGNKEKQEWCGHAVHGAQEKLPLVEEKIVLPGFVQTRMAKAVLVVNILQGQQRGNTAVIIGILRKHWAQVAHQMVSGGTHPHCMQLWF